jgi:hypothetical protein
VSRMGVHVVISYSNMVGRTGVLMAVGKHGKVDGGFGMADGRVHGGDGVGAGENGVRGFRLLVLFVASRCGKWDECRGLWVLPSGRRHPVELQWESETSEYVAPSPAATKLELCT